MKKNQNLLMKILFPLAILSALFMLVTIAATFLFKEQIFIERETISPIEVIILIGFIFILTFNITSIIFLVNKIKKDGNFVTTNFVLLLFGFFCIAMMLGEKTMLDEIGREMKLGWETTGEVIILTVLLSIQMIYSLLIFFKVTPKIASTIPILKNVIFQR